MIKLLFQNKLLLCFRNVCEYKARAKRIVCLNSIFHFVWQTVYITIIPNAVPITLNFHEIGLQYRDIYHNERVRGNSNSSVCMNT